jgi:hypothetical protein
MPLHWKLKRARLDDSLATGGLQLIKEELRKHLQSEKQVLSLFLFIRRFSKLIRLAKTLAMIEHSLHLQFWTKFLKKGDKIQNNIGCSCLEFLHPTQNHNIDKDS